MPQTDDSVRINELRLVWVDLEMTGLDVTKDVILEIAVIITGPDLQPIDQFHSIVHQPELLIASMIPLVREMHTKNGLIDRVRAATSTLKDAEAGALACVKRHIPAGQGVLAGNSIHVDRMFLRRHMPRFEEYLHYRQVDVSSIKVLSRAWYPDLPRVEKPEKDHTALSDIRASIAELAHYRAELFKKSEQG
ncbi:MAG: oligoribonuclease [Nitrospira sp.]|nr:oligoribonuclease [Nitrospira sp.]